MDNTIDKDMEKIKKYIEYLENYGNQYCNAFEVLNIQENTLTELIAWLFDVNSNKDKPISEIKKSFFEEFMNLLFKENEVDEKSINIIFSSDIEVNTQDCNKDGRPDIVLKSKKGEFICIIENKIAAKLSISNGKTQIENYYNKYNQSEYENKFFVFICGNKDFYPTRIVKEHCSEKNYSGEYAIKTIEELLKDKEFIILEHFDIIKILSKVLKEKHDEKFENDILKPTSFEAMKSIVKLLLNDEKEINNIISYLQKQNPNPKYFLYENLKEKFKSSGSITIPLKKILNEEKDTEKIINILCQYIEYCELHNGEVDCFQAYTKLIDGEPVWNICERILANKEKWQKLKESYNNNIFCEIEASRRKDIIKCIKDILKEKHFEIEENRARYKITFSKEGNKHVIDNVKHHSKLYLDKKEIINEDEYNKIFYSTNESMKTQFEDKINDELKN